jgi:hypothetical protein
MRFYYSYSFPSNKLIETIVKVYKRAVGSAFRQRKTNKLIVRKYIKHSVIVPNKF